MPPSPSDITEKRPVPEWQQLPENRIVPHNEEIEQFVLGGLMMNNTSIDIISEFLKPEHFYIPVNGRIYEACCVLRLRNSDVNPLTLGQYFKEDKDLQHIDGNEYLVRLASQVITTSDLRNYAQILFDLYLRRQLVEIGEDMEKEARSHDLEKDAQDQIQQAEEKLYILSQTGVARRDFQSFQTVLVKTIEDVTRAVERDRHLTGVTTGLADLDHRLGGLQDSDLIILAGRPSMGKTALATNIAYNAADAYHKTAGKEGAVVGFFSLEMSAEQLATRILSDVARIPSEKIRKGEVSRDDMPKLIQCAQDLHAIPLFVDDTAGLTLSALRTRAMRLKRQHNMGLLVIDYLQLLQASSRHDNRVQEVSEITRNLKILAKDLNIPVLALSQLSRQVEQREDKRPQLSDLRESGSIEQDADVVSFVFREAYYKQKNQPEPGTPEHMQWQEDMDRIYHLAEVIIAKQRHGPTGITRLHFEGAFTRFSNLETRIENH